jgi:hypothetical protein
VISLIKGFLNAYAHSSGGESYRIWQLATAKLESEYHTHDRMTYHNHFPEDRKGLEQLR